MVPDSGLEMTGRLVRQFILPLKDIGYLWHTYQVWIEMVLILRCILLCHVWGPSGIQGHQLGKMMMGRSSPAARQ